MREVSNGNRWRFNLCIRDSHTRTHGAREGDSKVHGTRTCRYDNPTDLADDLVIYWTCARNHVWISLSSIRTVYIRAWLWLVGGRDAVRPIHQHLSTSNDASGSAVRSIRVRSPSGSAVYLVCGSVYMSSTSIRTSSIDISTYNKWLIKGGSHWVYFRNG